MTNVIDEETQRINAFKAFCKQDGHPVPDDEEPEQDGNQFESDGMTGEYEVLTDEEADERAKEYIEQSLWAFNPSFLAEFTNLPEEVFIALQPQCEGANDAISLIIEGGDGIEAFVEEAISGDGRGHFMSSYDGQEHEITVSGGFGLQDVTATTFYIYRTN